MRLFSQATDLFFSSLGSPVAEAMGGGNFGQARKFTPHFLPITENPEIPYFWSGQTIGTNSEANESQAFL